MNVQAFLSEQSYSPQTVSTYGLVLSRFAEWLGDSPLGTFSAQDFDRYTAGRGWSRNYVYLQQSALRAYCRWALESGELAERPPFMSKKVLRRGMSRGLRALTLAEIKQLTDFLLAHRGRRSYRRSLAMLLVSYDAGLRASEVCSLTMVDLDLDTRRVQVLRKRSQVTINSFGELTRWAIRQWLGDRAALANGHPHLFLTDEGLPLNRQGWRLICLRLARSAGVKHFGPHAIRRATAVSYREQAAPTLDVCRAMGWHGTGGTALYEHYSQLFCVDPLERFMPSASLPLPAELVNAQQRDGAS
jgi:site-specific recombinase XerD